MIIIPIVAVQSRRSLNPGVSQRKIVFRACTTPPLLSSLVSWEFHSPPPFLRTIPANPRSRVKLHTCPESVFLKNVCESVSIVTNKVSLYHKQTQSAIETLFLAFFQVQVQVFRACCCQLTCSWYPPMVVVKVRIILGHNSNQFFQKLKDLGHPPQKKLRVAGNFNQKTREDSEDYSSISLWEASGQLRKRLYGVGRLR